MGEVHGLVTGGGYAEEKGVRTGRTEVQLPGGDQAEDHLSPTFLWMGKKSFCVPCSSSCLSRASAGQQEILFLGVWSMDSCESSSWRPVALKPGEVL